jgi:hypothetical protein
VGFRVDQAPSTIRVIGIKPVERDESCLALEDAVEPRPQCGLTLSGGRRR